MQAHDHIDRIVTTQIDDRILISYVRGSWTMAQFQANHEYSQSFVRQLNDTGDWASLVVIEDTLVSCIDVLEAGRNAIPTNPDCSHLKALAWVIAPEIEGYVLLRARYRAIFEGILPNQIFSAIDEAKAWLQAQLSATPT
ncbi:hypothetical protein RF679_00910 [Undibacterium cyanobacteriorum]|uniref:STAS/SEC14 domain-containing protein n=1 Tax=Undibacterium cyanobacteriorum TaxID=3073561 RepID=A0ABY9RI12_9BURK|nr:hypothetical protein [Undibacterium sp. 20NA77.5]WMW80856.1 hypothetical protein RF679_00910 [Undibacterium sp. 20NA77.5]